MPEEQEVPVEETVAAPEEGESTSESAADDNASNPEGEQKQTAYQKRIDRLTREKNDAARTAEYWRQEALKRNEAPAKVEEKPKADGKPKEDDYTTASDYVEALADWKIEQRAAEDRAKQQKQEQERSQAELQAKAQTDLASFRKTHPDFDEVMENAAFATPDVFREEILSTASPAAMLYFFAKNPDEANRISRLSDPRKVAKEVGKIEAKLPSAPAEKQAPTTTAPSPIKPVAASRQAVAQLPDTDDDEEYFRRQREQQAKR